MAEVRPIDANVLERNIRGFCEGCDSCGGVRCRACNFGDALDTVADAPILDYAPVRHGKWELWEDDYQAESWLQCSECGRKVMLEYDDSVTDEDVPRLTEQYPYCHCGAKMDGGKNDD